MKLLILFALISFPLFAQETVSFRNDREGKSYFSNNSSKRSIKRVLREVRGEEIKEIYRQALLDLDNNICSYDLNQNMKRSFLQLRPKFKQMEGAIHYLRSVNEIDDVVVKVLLDAHTTVTTRPDLPKDPRMLLLPRDRTKVDEMVKLIGEFNTRFQKNSCFDDAYRSLVNEITKLDKNIKSSHLEALLVEAYERKLINGHTYVSLEQGRMNKLDETWLTLKSYHQKRKSLRLHKPLRDPNERTNFVTDRFHKERTSRRVRLMEYYSDFQIILMADVVKNLRMRLEADKAEILIYRRDEIQDRIPLEPMERFRMALKLLRKEMKKLSLNHYFNGRVPDYMDLMTAAYETSLIPASELDELAGLEEIWNPKKSFWDKAQVWVRGFSSIATVVIPPPYGFIPSLAVVIIEMTTKKDKTNENDDTSLF